MKKVRIALSAALVVALAILVIVCKTALSGWALWLGVPAIIVFGFLALAVVILLASTLFPVKDGDLWETAYFRYMRALWEERWGGHNYPLQISVCRAGWLSVLTFAAWFSAIGFAGWFIYALIITGWFFPGSLLETIANSGNGALTGCIVASIVCFIIMVGLMALLFWNENVDARLPKFYKISSAAAGILVAIILILLFIAVPIAGFGVGTYFTWVGILAGVGLVIWGIYLLIKKGIPGLFRFFTERTVPGVLASGRVKAWKEKVCPLIVQKWPENKV